MTVRDAGAPARHLYSRNPYKRIRVHGVQVYEHRFVYEQCYGPIPRGFVIHHLDGDYQNNSPSNLVALSKEEHLYWHTEGWDRPEVIDGFSALYLATVAS